MRTSSLVTISLPPALVKTSERAAKARHMTRSELFRVALRDYLEFAGARSLTKREEFLAMLAKSRAEYERGETYSLDEVAKRFGV